MFYNKYPHPANFSFADSANVDEQKFVVNGGEFPYQVEHFEGGISRLFISNKSRWQPNRPLIELNHPKSTDTGVLGLGADASLQIRADREIVLKTDPAGAFGVNGEQWIIQLQVGEGAKFYGMGEKNLGRLELSGLRAKFWNTDVWGDFHWAQIINHPVDPPYLSIPYLIIKRGDTYVGVLLFTTYPAFMQTPGRDMSQVFIEWQHTSPTVVMGAYGGEPDVYFIVGPTLKELTRKLSKLVGTTPLPPLWSLGYHQCRWGYKGEKDLNELESKFEALEFPVDGLWLDIDYMRGFRVFTTSDEHFPNGVEAATGPLVSKGRKVIPILDPGVKVDPGYDVYEDGLKKDVFCYNNEGRRFHGIVWPGETVYPDFTLPAAREWWAGYVKTFQKLGFDAAWVDMNDPSTGPVEPDSMLFNHGKESHAKQRNNYALGMQMATHEGFAAARPGHRPFVLSRSGSLGTSRYSAIWTGDNFSNYVHLAMSISTTINLGLSSIPFNGPDVGGFGGEPTPQLMRDWVKACFLFPFFRNHNGGGLQKGQEPWRFDDATCEVVRKFVRLRYKFLPHLYNLFWRQEEVGDPVLRPIFYEFESDRPSEEMSDQFMIGEGLVHAPIVTKTRSRSVYLPGGKKTLWFDLSTGIWNAGGKHRVKSSDESTPLYARAGTVLALAPGVAKRNGTDLNNVELFFVAPATGAGHYCGVYRADGGDGYGYREGNFSELQFEAKIADHVLEITVNEVKSGAGKIRYSILVPEGFAKVSVNGEVAKTASENLELTGQSLVVLRVL